MEIVVINLKRSPERRAFMEEQLGRAGLPFTIFEAVDGRALDLAAVERYDRGLRLGRYGIDLTRGEIAAYLSHDAIIARARRAGSGRVCVLEDDAVLPEDFPALLARIDALEPGCELVALTGMRTPSHLELGPFGEGQRLCRLLGPPCTNPAYVLNARGAEKIAATAGTILRQIDITMGRYWANGLRIFAVLPYPIHVHPAFQSDIGQDRVDVWDLPGMGHWRLKRRARKLADSVGKRAANLGILVEHGRLPWAVKG